MPVGLPTLYTEFMNRNHLNLEPFSCSAIHGGYTLQTPEVPERGSLALHICDNPEDVLNARALLAQDTLPLDHWVLAWQKHTGRVVRVSAQDRGRGALEAESSILETDGLYTTDPDVLIGVFTADCLGILLYDPAVPFVAAVHSGWRGTAQAILIHLLEALKKDGLLHPATLQVRFSPSLMKDSFEVQEDVVEAFEKMAKEYDLDLSDVIFPQKNGRFLIDHQALQIHMLQKYGIPAENIHLSSTDTKTSPECFSYRRDGRNCGEHFSWIYIDSSKEKPSTAK